MARVLVLGATGDQGHPLIARLLEAGLTPVAALEIPVRFWARSLQGRNRPKPVSGNPPGPPK